MTVMSQDAMMITDELKVSPRIGEPSVAGSPDPVLFGTYLGMPMGMPTLPILTGGIHC